MKIMVLNDGETYTSIQGCQIVEIDADDNFSDDEIENRLKDLNVHNIDPDDARILGQFDHNGNYIKGDPRTMDEKEFIPLNGHDNLNNDEVESILDLNDDERILGKRDSEGNYLKDNNC